MTSSGQLHGANVRYASLEHHPTDTAAAISKFHENSLSQGKSANKMKDAIYLHSMQSIFLGSDRRYNRYWLFVGPCNASDPGHKRVYFESSEDGHWEVIDTEEVLSLKFSDKFPLHRITKLKHKCYFNYCSVFYPQCRLCVP